VGKRTAKGKRTLTGMKSEKETGKKKIKQQEIMRFYISKNNRKNVRFRRVCNGKSESVIKKQKGGGLLQQTQRRGCQGESSCRIYRAKSHKKNEKGKNWGQRRRRVHR